jgi:hypothetical protein
MMGPDTSETWFHWFYTNAPAAWLSAFLATASLIFVLKARAKPRRVVIREVGRSSLVRIWPGVRKKIKMTFDGNNIEALGQIDIDVSNCGSQVIQQPEFTVVPYSIHTLLLTRRRRLAKSRETRSRSNFHSSIRSTNINRSNDFHSR